MAGVGLVASPLHRTARATDWVRGSAYALSVGAFVALLLVCVAGLWYHHNDTLALSQRRVENLAYILSDHLRRSVEAIDATLAQLSLHSEHVGDPTANADTWKSVLDAALSGLAGVGSLSIVDERGTITHSTVSTIVGQSRRDLYIFRHLSDITTQGLVADTPFQSPATGRMLIPIGRRLLNQQGKFVGVAVATLEPDRLRNFYRSIDVGPGGIVWVLHPAGHVVFREPSTSETVPDIRGSPLFAALHADPTSGFLRAPFEPGGATYLSAYRTNADLPLIVAVSFAERDVLARWWTEATIAFVLMIVMATGVFIGGFLVGREKRARAVADTRVAEAGTALRQEIEERRLLFETSLDLILSRIVTAISSG